MDYRELICDLLGTLEAEWPGDTDKHRPPCLICGHTPVVEALVTVNGPVHIFHDPDLVLPYALELMATGSAQHWGVAGCVLATVRADHLSDVGTVWVQVGADVWPATQDGWIDVALDLWGYERAGAAA